jgi:endonuclease/exonuclease/phosphatase family metal-dependent hydrolase
MPPHRPVSRRAVLRSGAGLAALTATPTRGPTFPLPQVLSVYTQNLGLGTRLSRLIDLRSGRVDPENVFQRFRDVRRSGVAERVGAVASHIASEGPALVALQEAALVRRGPVDGDDTSNAETVAVDYLAALTDALATADGPAYRVAAVVTNADEEFVADSGSERFDLRLTDRDVVLVREDVTVESTETENYALNAQLTLRDGRTVVATRGYALVEARLDGSPLTFVSTHLSSTSSDIREAQAAELAERVDSLDRPVVVAGDVNSAPSDGDQTAYSLLTGPLRDVWSGGGGPTCCQFSNLTNEESRLRRRIDVVLVRGAVEPLGARRVFHDPSSRVTVTVDGEPTERWVSDHAGVVADLVVSGEVDLFTALRGLLG